MRHVLPLIATMVGCSQPPPPSDPTGPSVLLITLDTTRADHLGAYGYPDAETPTWDALATRGTTWDRAYAVQPLTIPSHSSILTGQVPPTHGVRDNGDFILGPEAVTLAERFAAAGYRTAAFTSAFPTHERWGFSQGFDLYHDPLDRLPTQQDWRDQRRADEVVDDAIQTLATLPDDRPRFVWVHMFDAHWPYEPPEPWLTAHEGHPYDGEIAFADAQGARLVKWWEERHPDGVILVTADHGEGLGDGGEKTHGFLLHDGTIRVPLIAAGPGIEAGARIADPVSSIDIAPTLLNLAGIPLHDGLQGRDLREGGSEVPYHEALTGMYSLGLAPLHAMTEEGGRYTEGGWGAWYPVGGVRIADKPAGGDLDALSARLHERVAAFEVHEARTASLDPDALEMLTALGYMGGGNPEAEAGELDPRDVIDAIPLTWQARQRIQQGMYRPATEILERLDRKMPGAWGVDQLYAQLAMRQGRMDEAESRYTDLFLRSPTSTVALQLAHIAGLRTDWRESEEWYGEALALQPHSPEAMAGLVRSLQAQGELEEAEDLANEFLEVFPDHAELVLLQAEMFLAQQMPDRALPLAEQALDRMPWSPWAHTVTGQALWETGQPDPAIERLQDAVRLAPYDARIRLKLAECLFEVHRYAETVRILAPLAQLFPDDEEIARRHEEARDALAATRRRRPGTGYEAVLPPPPRPKK